MPASPNRQIRAAGGREITFFCEPRARFERSDVNKEIIESGIEILFKDKLSSQISQHVLNLSPKHLQIDSKTLTT